MKTCSLSHRNLFYHNTWINGVMADVKKLFTAANQGDFKYTLKYSVGSFLRASLKCKGYCIWYYQRAACLRNKLRYQLFLYMKPCWRSDNFCDPSPHILHRFWCGWFWVCGLNINVLIFTWILKVSKSLICLSSTPLMFQQVSWPIHI